MKNTKTKVIEVRVSPELDAEFKAVVKAQGLTESQVVRSLVEEYIRKYERRDFSDLARKINESPESTAIIGGTINTGHIVVKKREDEDA